MIAPAPVRPAMVKPPPTRSAGWILVISLNLGIRFVLIQKKKILPFPFPITRSELLLRFWEFWHCWDLLQTSSPTELKCNKKKLFFESKKEPAEDLAVSHDASFSKGSFTKLGSPGISCNTILKGSSHVIVRCPVLYICRSCAFCCTILGPPGPP